MKLINGIEISERIYSKILTDISTKAQKTKLGIILANNDEASQRYVRIKKEKALELGIDVEVIEFSEEELNSTELKNKTLVELEKMNNDKSISGILIQLPLHHSISSDSIEITDRISPEKDVDGLTSFTLGRISQGDFTKFIPATVAGILECIKYVMQNDLEFGNTLEGKNITIINNSNLIGKPLSNILASENATVSLLNKSTKNLKEFTLQSDIVIAATGQGQILDYTFFKKGAVVIDITNIRLNGKTVGDVIVSPELEAQISWYTPVPGGVGPLTVASLMKNLIKSQ